jgi:hypothetical protein
MELAGEGVRAIHTRVRIPKMLKWCGERTPKRPWSTLEVNVTTAVFSL